MLQVRLDQLAQMDAPAKERAMDDLVREAKAPRNGQAQALDRRIREFETRYEMSSEAMKAKFARGEIQDTADISSWLMLLDVRGR